ncbi:MAG TPA: GTP-binding protein [Defluviitaleaceae bacterium]|jgi:Ni2+-binding GTPase involved in maturation of urease and hydrogenase|nr:cobalamin biosynthesis protein [Candidatus Epulonipiscium sp.]HOQ16960.1 GTP-binding protein [Defluviitaleaceae bacterium]HPT75733.1 GTP-binding protein [Defluviitaleaceae bacterium]HQD50999.1 GTP-binding protein [Defluviitaleaceae bacterium]
MKLLLVGGPPSTGKTTVIQRIIEKRQGKYKMAYLKMDVVYAHEEELIKEKYNIHARTVYAGDLCPDHAVVMILTDAIRWAEDLKADLLIIESAGLCLRCSPYLNQGLGLVVLSMLSGIHSVDKMKQLICFADVAVLTMNDLVCQAEREVYIKKLKNSFNDLKVIETNALQGIAIEYLCNLIDESEEIHLGNLELKGNPPLGTCTICIGSKKIGWKNHYGVVRQIDSNAADYMYRGD